MATTKVKGGGKSAGSCSCIRRAGMLLLMLGLVEESFDGIVDDGHIDGGHVDERHRRWRRG